MNTFPLERPFPQMKTTSMQPLLIASRRDALKVRVLEASFNKSKRLSDYGRDMDECFIVEKREIITSCSWSFARRNKHAARFLKLAKKLFRIKLKDITSGGS